VHLTTQEEIYHNVIRAVSAALTFHDARFNPLVSRT